MKFSGIASLLVAASSVSAMPAPEKPADVEAFNLMSLRSASPIHFGQFSAAMSSVFINLKDQGAKCEGKANGEATFSLKDGELFLYHSGSTPPQQVYVDRSGMGQGKVGYITGDQSPPKNAELKGWVTKKQGEFDYLSFNGAGLLACPKSIQNSWSVWVDAGVANPGGNKGCLGMSATVEPVKEPVSCQYSQ